MKMKKYFKKLLTVVLYVALLSILCACDFDESRNNFSGGKLLDEEKLSEIKSSIITEESEISEAEAETKTQNKESTVLDSAETESIIEIENDETEKENITNNYVTEGSSETNVGDGEESVSNLESEESSETEITNEEQTVYWTKSGKVWHLSPDCHHLKNSTNILSGTIEDAIAAKKTKVCSSCEK